MSRRRTSPAQRAPQTLPDAIRLLERFSMLANEAQRLEVDRAESKAAIDAAADALIAPVEAELRDIVRQLKPWWAVARDEMTGGKRKSIELAGCIIGHRVANPSLVHPKPEEQAIALLRELGPSYAWTLRETTSLNKQGLINFLRADDDNVLAIAVRGKIADLGFSVSQRETFFVDVAPARDVTEMVDADPEGAAA